MYEYAKPAAPRARALAADALLQKVVVAFAEACRALRLNEPTLSRVDVEALRGWCDWWLAEEAAVDADEHARTGDRK